ncbi:uncharacterized protein LOC125015319 [Mugil cephalus]|uniref:uncharacterized protein LOC125015319 n=1 Tax=Mugil cephalus TaxID=48193 RepID=UPI001FB7D59E|nr:uncharacterized protein LOC125015319 [Mugil cephalus]
MTALNGKVALDKLLFRAVVTEDNLKWTEDHQATSLPVSQMSLYATETMMYFSTLVFAMLWVIKGAGEQLQTPQGASTPCEHCWPHRAAPQPPALHLSSTQQEETEGAGEQFQPSQGTSMKKTTCEHYWPHRAKPPPTALHVWFTQQAETEGAGEQLQGPGGASTKKTACEHCWPHRGEPRPPVVETDSGVLQVHVDFPPHHRGLPLTVFSAAVDMFMSWLTESPYNVEM